MTSWNRDFECNLCSSRRLSRSVHLYGLRSHLSLAGWQARLWCWAPRAPHYCITRLWPIASIPDLNPLIPSINWWILGQYTGNAHYGKHGHGKHQSSCSGSDRWGYGRVPSTVWTGRRALCELVLWELHETLPGFIQGILQVLFSFTTGATSSERRLGKIIPMGWWFWGQDAWPYSRTVSRFEKHSSWLHCWHCGSADRQWVISKASCDTLGTWLLVGVEALTLVCKPEQRGRFSEQTKNLNILIEKAKCIIVESKRRW